MLGKQQNQNKTYKPKRTNHKPKQNQNQNKKNQNKIKKVMVPYGSLQVSSGAGNKKDYSVRWACSIGLHRPGYRCCWSSS